MEAMLFDHLQSLEKSRTNWRVKARVTRMWPTTSPESGTVKGYNLILLDDDNLHIHTYVYPDNLHSIGKDVVEGGVYIFENFQVRDTIGKLKPMSSNFFVRLLSSTSIHHVKDGMMIPLYKFEFMDLEDLHVDNSKYLENEIPEFAIDVIGVVEDFENVKKIGTRFSDRDIVRFIITDGSVSAKVSIWGELVVNVHDNYHKISQKPIIAIFTSTKLTMFMNSVQIGTLPSLKIYLNLDVDIVSEMWSRLEEEGYKSLGFISPMTMNNATNSAIEKLSLKVLIDSSSLMYAKKIIICTFKIVNIEDEDNWWFYSCNNCKEEAEKIAKKYKCTTCPRTYPFAEKRFRVLVMAEDDTFSCNIILMDRVVKRIVGNTATNLLKDQRKVLENILMLEVVKDIVGKEVIVVIELTEAKVRADSIIYVVVDMYDASLASSSIGEYSPIPTCSSYLHSDTSEEI